MIIPYRCNSARLHGNSFSRPTRPASVWVTECIISNCCLLFCLGDVRFTYNPRFLSWKHPHGASSWFALLNGIILIANKVTTIFSVTPFKSISHTLHALPTEESRIMTGWSRFYSERAESTGSGFHCFRLSGDFRCKQRLESNGYARGRGAVWSSDSCLLLHEQSHPPGHTGLNHRRGGTEENFV